jgi:nitrogen regulatory protein P-II 1
MKKIEATIRSSKFDEVQEALHNIGVDYFTYMEVKGVGKQKSEVFYRGAHYDMGSIPRIMLDIVVPEEKTDLVVECILKAAKTGDIGDGKIFIYDVEKVIRIRTGELGKAAL